MAPLGARLPYAHKLRCLPQQNPVPFPSSLPGVGVGTVPAAPPGAWLALPRGDALIPGEEQPTRGGPGLSMPPRTAVQPTITTQKCACASVPADPKQCHRASSHPPSQLEPCRSTTCHRQQARGSACPCGGEAAPNILSSPAMRNVRTSFPLAGICWGHS